MTENPPFHSSVGFQLSQLGVLATRAWSSMLAERGLTPHQHVVLLTLLADGPTGLTALAAAALVDPRNMGPVLSPLEQRGVVESQDDPDDRRRRLLLLTPTGEATARELAGAAAEIEDDLLAPLTPTQRTTLQALLLTVSEQARSTRGRPDGA